MGKSGQLLMGNIGKALSTLGRKLWFQLLHIWIDDIGKAWAILDGQHWQSLGNYGPTALGNYR